MDILRDHKQYISSFQHNYYTICDISILPHCKYYDNQKAIADYILHFYRILNRNGIYNFILYKSMN